jgi:hypothetical protein
MIAARRVLCPPRRAQHLEHDNPAALAAFKTRAAVGKTGGMALSRPAFKALLAELHDEYALENEETPSDKDLDAAFTLADVDKSGGVDEREFLHLYELVAAGKVHGLSKASSLFGGAAAAKKKEEVKKVLREEPPPKALEPLKDFSIIQWETVREMRASDWV